MVNFEVLLFIKMTLLQENLDFEAFRNQVIADYRKAFFFKKIIEDYQWSSFYRSELLFSVISNFSKDTDLVYYLPFSFAFTGQINDNILSVVNNKNLIIQGEETAKTRDFTQNISVISGMALAGNQITSNNDRIIFAGLSVAGMTEIDFLKMMENISGTALPTNVILLDIHKAKGDFLKVRDYFEPKSEHSLKTLVVDVVDYQSMYKTLSEGIATTRATGVPVIFYPIEKLINQVEYFSEETTPLKKIKNWMLVNHIAQEKEIIEIEEEINHFLNHNFESGLV